MVFLSASFLWAQQIRQINTDATPGANLNYSSSTSTPTSPMPADPPAAAPVGGGPGQIGTSQERQWHLSVSPYLWLPGAHGTIGALGRDAGFKASASDLLSHFRFGLLGAGEARYDRILMTDDLMFMRLGADKAIPFPPALRATSANFTANIFILTPKVGVRLIDQQTVKADFLTGIRYWHFGESLSFNPSPLGLKFSRSQNFVDPLVGGRVEVALTPKVAVTAAGDVGGWGAASQLEYQVVGLLGYKLKPNMALQAGYRYLYLDYQKNSRAATVLKTAMSGVVLGVTLNLK
jgi:hypothetical protein